MKVKIQQRSVYHKFAEVEIDIDKKKLQEYLDSGATIQDYLFDYSNLYDDKIDEAISKAEYHYGFGTDADANSHHNSCMNEEDSESEWRFECEELKTGGHL